MPAKRARSVDIGFLQETVEETDLSTMFAQGAEAPPPVAQIAIAHLLDNPYQPRIAVDPAALDELAGVIKTQGFQGVLVARPHPTQRGAYQLAFGHRRRDAARRAGLATVPVMVREIGEEELVELAIAENIQRTDLTALEEGKTFELMSTVLGYTYEQIAKAIGKTRGYVENRLRVARAPADVQALVTAKPDSLRAVATLIQVEEPDLRGEMIAALQTGQLTADDLVGYLQTARARPQPADAHPASAAARESAPAPDAGPAAAAPPRAGVPAESERAGSPVVGPSRAGVAEPGPTDPEAEAATRTLARVGNGHLVAALRALTKFQGSVADRDTISVTEFVTLSDLYRLAETLYERYSPAADQT